MSLSERELTNICDDALFKRWARGQTEQVTAETVAAALEQLLVRAPMAHMAFLSFYRQTYQHRRVKRDPASGAIARTWVRLQRMPGESTRTYERRLAAKAFMSWRTFRRWLDIGRMAVGMWLVARGIDVDKPELVEAESPHVGHKNTEKIQPKLAKEREEVRANED